MYATAYEQLRLSLPVAHAQGGHVALKYALRAARPAPACIALSTWLEPDREAVWAAHGHHLYGVLSVRCVGRTHARLSACMPGPPTPRISLTWQGCCACPTAPCSDVLRHEGARVAMSAWQMGRLLV